MNLGANILNKLTARLPLAIRICNDIILVNGAMEGRLFLGKNLSESEKPELSLI